MFADNTVDEQIDIVATITIPESGETFNLPIELDIPKESTKNRSYQENSSGNIITTTTFNIYDYLPQSRASVGSSKDDGMVTATINVKYTLNKSNGQVRVEQATGSWSAPSYAVISNRQVGYENLYLSEKKYPTSNSFSYITKFDYTYYFPETGAWSEATIKMSGMGGSAVLFVNVNIPL